MDTLFCSINLNTFPPVVSYLITGSGLRPSGMQGPDADGEIYSYPF